MGLENSWRIPKENQYPFDCKQGVSRKNTSSIFFIKLSSYYAILKAEIESFQSQVPLLAILQRQGRLIISGSIFFSRLLFHTVYSTTAHWYGIEVLGSYIHPHPRYRCRDLHKNLHHGTQLWNNEHTAVHYVKQCIGLALKKKQKTNGHVMALHSGSEMLDFNTFF